MMVDQNGVSVPVARELRADIRGVRKIEDGEVFLVISNGGSGGTSFTVAMKGLVRLLVKLP